MSVPNTRITERAWEPGDHESWMAVDFDGTLAHYDRWEGAGVLGTPIAAMVERIKEWLAEGRDVRIFTARADSLECRVAIRKWCEQHLGRVLEITNVKDRWMYELWDDRAVQVVSNTGRRADELSDEQRLAVLQEVWDHARATASSDGFRTLYSYERVIKERSGT